MARVTVNKFDGYCVACRAIVPAQRGNLVWLEGFGKAKLYCDGICTPVPTHPVMPPAPPDPVPKGREPSGKLNDNPDGAPSWWVERAGKVLGSDGKVIELRFAVGSTGRVDDMADMIVVRPDDPGDRETMVSVIYRNNVIRSRGIRQAMDDCYSKALSLGADCLLHTPVTN